jgi:transcriptional regulator with XRE-family HTH domain
MRNPLAAQRRLGTALLNLRLDRGWSHAKLAREADVSASVISRIENPFSDITRRPAVPAVRLLLAALGVPEGSAEYRTIEQHAEHAAGRGWWDWPRYARMGAGQEQYAIVEAGTAAIDEYGGLFLPGLVQTAAYARHRAMVAPEAAPEAAKLDLDAIVAGRMERQRILDGATYRLIVEEPAIRRRSVPPAVMLAQLEHLLALAERPTVSVRIVPVDADLGEGPVPRAPFGHMTYPDRDDPQIVIVDNVNRALLVTDDDEVKGYAQLHQRLRDAALSDADSAAIIRKVADALATAI